MPRAIVSVRGAGAFRRVGWADRRSETARLVQLLGMQAARRRRWDWRQNYRWNTVPGARWVARTDACRMALRRTSRRARAAKLPKRNARSFLAMFGPNSHQSSGQVGLEASTRFGPASTWLVWHQPGWSDIGPTRPELSPSSSPPRFARLRPNMFRLRPVSICPKSGFG